MRKSFNTLAALVTKELKHDVLACDLYLFVSRDRKRAKVLYFVGTDVCLSAKRMEHGKLRYSVNFAVGVAVDKYLEHLPLERPLKPLYLRATPCTCLPLRRARAAAPLKRRRRFRRCRPRIRWSRRR